MLTSGYLVRLPDDTKCNKCGQVIKDVTRNFNLYRCQECGASYTYHINCAPKRCPKCGGELNHGTGCIPRP